MSARTVLSAFGSAKLAIHNSATRFGSYQELQFNERGKMIGLKVIVYSLERERIITQKLGERNFNVFYYLLNSTSQELRHSLALDASIVFPYLNYGAAPNPGMDDLGQMEGLQDALKNIGISKRAQNHIFQLLAAILHMGNIHFIPDEEDDNERCTVQNYEVLELVASLLEVNPDVLEMVLTSRSQIMGRDLVTQFLSLNDAKDNRDNLAMLLYNVLFMWIVEAINKRLCDDDQMTNLIALVDFPGGLPDKENTLLQFAYCNERIDNFILKRIFEYGNQEMRSEGMYVRDTSHSSTTAVANAYRLHCNKIAKGTAHALPGDFVRLFRGGQGQIGSRSPVFQDMFSESIISMDAFEKSQTTVLRGASLARRKPSLRRSSKSNIHKDSVHNEALQLVPQMDSLIDALENCNVKTMFCVRPNMDDSTSFDTRRARSQVEAMQLANILAHVYSRGGDYNVRFSFEDFAAKYSSYFDVPETLNARDKCAMIKKTKNLSDQEIHIGESLVILRDDVWHYLENLLRRYEHNLKRKKKAGAGGKGRGRYTNADNRTEYSYDGDSMYSDNDAATDYATEYGDMDSLFGGEGNDNGDNEMAMARGHRAQNEIVTDDPNLDILDNAHIEEYTVTSARRWWIRLTWALTWWIPTFVIRTCGGMKRDDIRMAWREKVAICILIGAICAIQLFFIIGFGQIICPRQQILNLAELKSKNGGPNTLPLVGIYGGIYDLNDFYQSNYHSPETMKGFAGFDITGGFPRTPAYYCSYAKDFKIESLFSSDSNGSYIRVRHDEFYRRDLELSQRRIDSTLRRNLKALVGWDPNDVLALSSKTSSGNRLMFIINNRVYDLQPYINAAKSDSDKFLPVDILPLIQDNRGKDLSTVPAFMNAWKKNPDLRNCFNNLFVVGIVDVRKSSRCLFTNYILLAFTVLLATVIGGKFLAAIQLGSIGSPEEHDKFVMLQVPCYTEGEDSLRKCIDSLATVNYDDKRKLLFLICDGNIMGSGNDRPTPQIVLDILGVDSSEDPEPLSFQSLGEGSRQHNMGKVYSGLYEVAGHLVPYLVIVKMGKPTESSRPGNRGKRDSQMVLMRFLNKVYLDLPMSPLELEMYHQIKNVIGVNPSFYEYCLMVDADTVVTKDALTRLVSVMMHDTKVMGVCGETRISNDKDTWATMIQVYEYYISHHLAKAFESLFGSVTCLPGCFSMYRLRSANKSTPILCSSSLVTEYGDVNVDTLHKKNLLHLGEDRYLTTLMLKNFPQMKTVFTPDAKCDTVAPDRWNVLISQRRRWINSTIHNLFELLNISQLCGFCCFSMRFVIFIDLIATLIQPAIVFYLGYLIYLIIQSSIDPEQNLFPTISLILLAVIYGLQAIIFMIKREWQHIGWSMYLITLLSEFQTVKRLTLFCLFDFCSGGVYFGDSSIFFVPTCLFILAHG
jgi:chitin synthase